MAGKFNTCTEEHSDELKMESEKINRYIRKQEFNSPAALTVSRVEDEGF